jgi:hypothetical protein
MASANILTKPNWIDVYNERMYTRGLLIHYLDSRAPPLFFDGSTDINPIVFFREINQERRTNSSTKDDFPAPPVPVIPSTGVLQFSFFGSVPKF